MRKYRLCVSTVSDENGDTHRCYGVRFGDIILEDVTFSEERIRSLIYDLNKHQLEPIHLNSVIEDFLAI